MNEPTLTDTERLALQGARGLRVPTGGMSSVLDRCEREVARIKADAVDRERAAWATKIEQVCGWGVGRDTGGVDRLVPASELRALLAADDTEGKP